MQKFRSTWSEDEDSRLVNLMQNFTSNKWSIIAQHMGSRSAVQCMNRWTKILKPGLLKGYWSKEEDELLQEWVQANGPKKWSECAKLIKKRSAKQCRERWLNHLDPKIRRDEWTPEEDQQIYDLYKKYGTSWSKLAKEMNGRSENSIKNRFYSTIRSLIANEDGDSSKQKDKKRINKNQGFVDVLKNKQEDEELKERLDIIKSKIKSKCSVRDPLVKKRKSPNDFYENMYSKNFDDETKNPLDTNKKNNEEVNKSSGTIEAPTIIEEKKEPIEEKIQIKTETTNDIKCMENLFAEQKKEIEKLETNPFFKEYMNLVAWQSMEMAKTFIFSSMANVMKSSINNNNSNK